MGEGGEQGGDWSQPGKCYLAEGAAALLHMPGLGRKGGGACAGGGVYRARISSVRFWNMPIRRSCWARVQRASKRVLTRV